jgi:CheY-like chemotaxis protein
MNSARSRITVLVADDDPDDRLLTRDAFQQAGMPVHLDFVEDGNQLLDYLRRRGSYSDAGKNPLPSLILLDLNMPRRDGREVLAEIKSDPGLRHIPIVVLTTSKAEEDVARSYRSGSNSYIVKPVSFTALTQVVRELGRYWLETVDLPTEP